MEIELLQEVCDRLIGPIGPVGDTHIDEKRLENLKNMCSVTEYLLQQIVDVSRCKNSHMFSVKESGEYAQKFLDCLAEELNGSDDGYD